MIFSDFNVHKKADRSQLDLTHDTEMKKLNVTVNLQCINTKPLMHCMH